MDQTTLLLGCARFASAIARLCLGPLLPILTIQLGFSAADKPGLLSAYSSGYTSTQIVGGLLADRYGPIRIVSWTVALSSVLLVLLTHFTSAVVWTKLFFALGLVGGPLFPAGSAAISTHVQADRRAASAAIVDAAAALGTTVAALAPIIAERFGWRIVYLFTSMTLAFVAAGCYLQMQANTRIPSTRPISSVEKYPFQAILSPAVLATFSCHSADNFTRYSINAWAATMLTQQHHASATLVGSILATQEAAGVASRLLTGVYGPKQASFAMRGTMSAAAFAIQGVLQCMAFQAPTLFSAGALFVFSSVAVGAHSVGFRPVYFEAAPEHAGSISGFGNTVASLASAIGPVAVGYVQEVSWTRVGFMLMLMNIVGSLSAMVIASTKQIQTRSRGKVSNTSIGRIPTTKSS